jgi:hypothetical protein
LSKIEEYGIPLIIFNFNLIKGKQSMQNNIFSRQERGMYFTTRSIWEDLQRKQVLPKSSWDPGEILKQNHRYFQRYKVLNAGINMNHEKFWNNFTQMYRDHFIYLKLKREKKIYMAKIDHVIQT